MTRALIALLLGALLALPGVAAAPALAADVAADGKRKINLAGRQRMLSQRMAKAACFAAIGLDVDAHLRMMREAHALFDRTLAGLRDGDPGQGIQFPERNGKVLAGLATVEGLWAEYGAAIAEAAASGAVSDAQLETIAALNLPVLAEMNATVKLTERAYGASDVPLGLAIALNISGRQRMLTQKMSKEFCLIARGHEVETNRAALGKTVALFDASLEALRFGAPDVGIRPPQGQALIDKLAEVQALWDGLEPVFLAVAEGGEPDPMALVEVSQDNNTLLVTMNEAVFLFESE